jgi:diguanylate cyclase (GGDEF)-like protein
MLKITNFFFNNHQYEKQKEYIANNRQRIREQNYLLFKNSAFLFFILMTILVFLTFLFPELKEGRIIYLLSAASGGIFYIFSLFFLKKGSLSPLPFHYLLYTVVLWMACEDAVFLNHGEGSAVAFCGMILVFSMLTIDYSYRINWYIIFLTVAFIVCAYYFEPRPLAVRDIANSFIFCILSIMIGGIPRISKLYDFESERILQIERNIDTLTRIPNRRSLFEALIECENPECLSPYTGAIMIDIDNFKKYNDTYGHQAGDKVLQQIGCFLGDYGIDFKFDVFRYGGEEFLAMTKDRDISKLNTLAKNLVKTIRDLKITYKASSRGIITISVGYSFIDKDTPIEYESLIQQADSALYTAKKTGRNRAVKYVEKPASPSALSSAKNKTKIY